METAYGGDVARHGADGQVLVTARTRFLGHPANQQAPNALTASRRGHDDRLDLAARTPVEQAGQADDPAVAPGHPGAHPLPIGEVVIESRSRIVSANRRVPVDASVVRRQFRPQGPAGIVVTVGVVANDDLRRGWGIWLRRDRHVPMLPGFLTPVVQPACGAVYGRAS